MDFHQLFKWNASNIRLISFVFVLNGESAKKVKIDYVGFTIPELFVVGYGLDYDGEGRNLGAVYQLA
ncbi:MAG: hypothetical protein R2807_03395 [Chitinophagales bacterium]